MLKLYGAPLSNYYNMVKVALLEKGIEFEEVLTPPSQEPEYLARSPMGKIPCLETDSGFIAESIPILDYLEEAYPDNPLLPADPYARAKCRELCQIMELNIELTARRGFGVLRGGEVSDEVKAGIAQDVPKGAAAVKRLARFSPWIMGDTFTYADIVGYYSLFYAARAAKAAADVDVYDAVPGLKAWEEQVAARESVAKANADNQ